MRIVIEYKYYTLITNEPAAIGQVGRNIFPVYPEITNEL